MKEDLENKIMKDIKNGRVKLRSKYIFLAEKLSLGSGLILAVLLAILFFNLILFYIKETDNLIYLTFGPNGFLAFLESFPYLLIVTFIAIIFFVGFLIKKTDFSYKKSFGQWSIWLISFIIIAGTFLTFTNINNEIHKHHRIFMHPFFENKPFLKNGITGTIIQKTDNGLILNTDRGIKYINIENINIDPNFKERDFVIAIGDKQAQDFFANDIKRVAPDKMIFMKRELEHFPEDLDRDCMKNCFDQDNFFHDCMNKCKKE